MLFEFVILQKPSNDGSGYIVYSLCFEFHLEKIGSLNGIFVYTISYIRIII